MTQNKAAPFARNSDLENMREVVRSFCADCVSEAEVRRIMGTKTGTDPAIWKRIGGEIGALGLAAPEDFGGLGLGVQAQAVVAEELGAALLPGPVLGTLALAIPALCSLTDHDVKRRFLPALIAGDRRAAFAVPESGGRFSAVAVDVDARLVDDRWSVHGSFDNLVDGAAADVLIVAAKTGDDVSLFAVETGGNAVNSRPISVLDLTRRQASVTFAGARAELLARGAEAEKVCMRSFQVGATLLAAEQIGASDRLLSMTVEYLKTRVQFGRAIGSFQALKHRAADLLVALEQARSAGRYAVWRLDAHEDDDREIQRAVSLAKALCSDVFYQIAVASIQLHGGIGFVWEHPVHLYFKRAVTDAALLGTAQHHREIVAELLLDHCAPERILAAAE